MTTIVAISRQFGSGGARVGKALAQRVGFQYADREILSEAARALHVDATEVEGLEERTENIWEKIGSLFALGSPDTPFIPPTLPAVTEQQLLDAEEQVIRGLGEKGRVVIVGRGAAHMFGDDRHVLRVFLHAPLDERITLAMAEYGFTDRAQAELVVRESDQSRAEFVKALTGHDWTDAALYDITIDTTAIGLERTVELLADVVLRGDTEALPPVQPRTAADRDAR